MIRDIKGDTRRLDYSSTESRPHSVLVHVLTS